MANRGETKAQRAVLRCFDLEPGSTVDEVARQCGISYDACARRVSRLKESGKLRAAHVVDAAHSTLPHTFVVFVSVDAQRLSKGDHGLRSIGDLARYLQTKALKSARWKALVANEAATDTAVRFDSVMALSGGGEWDLLLVLRAADEDFTRDVFVTKYLHHLTGVAKTNTAAVMRAKPANRESESHPGGSARPANFAPVTSTQKSTTLIRGRARA